MATDCEEPGDECIHLIYPVTACTICTPPKPPTKAAKWDMLKPQSTFQKLGSRPVIAEFDGRCGQCNERIERDLDEIVFYRGQWCHAMCAD